MQKNLTVCYALTFFNVDNIHVEKYVKSMLNIYFPFKSSSLVNCNTLVIPVVND